jgi:hypothetical protein
LAATGKTPLTHSIGNADPTEAILTREELRSRAEAAARTHQIARALVKLMGMQQTNVAKMSPHANLTEKVQFALLPRQ